MAEVQSFCMHYVLHVLFWGYAHFLCSYTPICLVSFFSMLPHRNTASVESRFFPVPATEISDLSFFHSFALSLCSSLQQFFSHLLFQPIFSFFLSCVLQLLFLTLSLSPSLFSPCLSQTEWVHPSAHSGSLW